MAMRDLVAADCGGANPLTKLSRHFAKGESRRLIDQGTRRGGQLQHGMYLAHARERYYCGCGWLMDGEGTFPFPPDDPFTRGPLDQLRHPQQGQPAFRMDSLLQEMRNLEAASSAAGPSAAAAAVATAPQVSQLALQGENWDGVETRL